MNDMFEQQEISIATCILIQKLLCTAIKTLLHVQVYKLSVEHN